MSGIVISHDDASFSALPRIIDVQKAGGFNVSYQRKAASWSLVVFNRLINDEQVPYVEDDSGCFICVAGTFFYRGRGGRDAMQLALDKWQEGALNLSDTQGHFTLVIGDDDELFLWTDHLPSNRIYHDTGEKIFSNLLIPVLQAQPTLSIHEQGLYEYVWLQANHGTHTPFREVSAIAPYEWLHFHPEGVTRKRGSVPDFMNPDFSCDRQEAIVEHCTSQISDVLSSPICMFSGRVRCALSGGYDSRLIAANLIMSGCNASYYVYGKEDSPDRRVAEEISRNLSLELDAVEKPQQMIYTGHEYTRHIERKAIVFDGLYVEGLFDNGVDLDDRIERMRDSMLLVLGSGGEIFRNFFYLRSGRYTPRQVISTFWSTYDPSACTEAFDEASFTEALSMQLAHDIGVDPDLPMSRSQVELAYPLFRVRYWSTREIAVNQRISLVLYPYLHEKAIAGTPTIPLVWKDHGRLEGRMIYHINPRIAQISSDYGFPLTGDVPLSYHIKMQATYLRPTVLRRYIYRLRQRVRKTPAFMTSEIVRYGIPPSSLSSMKEFFRLEEIKDTAVYNRVATVEWLLHKHREYRSGLH